MQGNNNPTSTGDQAPKLQLIERKSKTATDSRVVQMPSLIDAAGHKFLRYGGSIERYRIAEKVSRRQATEMLLACAFRALYRDGRRAA